MLHVMCGVSCIFVHMLRCVANFVCTRLSLVFLVAPSLVAAQHEKNIWSAERTQDRISGAVQYILHVGAVKSDAVDPKILRPRPIYFVCIDALLCVRV